MNRLTRLRKNLAGRLLAHGCIVALSLSLPLSAQDRTSIQMRVGFRPDPGSLHTRASYRAAAVIHGSRGEGLAWLNTVSPIPEDSSRAWAIVGLAQPEYFVEDPVLNRQPLLYPIMGGMVGGIVGTVLGALYVPGWMLVESSPSDCTDEWCAVGGALVLAVGAIIGAVVGEPVGLACGVHSGNGKGGNIAADIAVSMAIAAAGVAVAVHNEEPKVLFAVPIAQLVGVVATERVTAAQGDRQTAKWCP